MLKPTLHFLNISCSILEQLRIEEALLRADDRNWCIVNSGTPAAIVMGISGKPHQLINMEKFQREPVPVIRRFSGGGTVFVDSGTYFVTFICNSDALQIPCYPKRVLSWSESLYSSVFEEHNFSVLENDYVMTNRKFGGNAQYMRKGRWLHHSSLLWDFKRGNMEYLLIPPKIPEYREERSHEDFLCSLSDYFPDKQDFEAKLRDALHLKFRVVATAEEAIHSVLELPHRRATKLEMLL